MFCEIDNTPHNIPYIWYECGEYFVEYCESHKHYYGAKKSYKSPFDWTNPYIDYLVFGKVSNDELTIE